MNVMILLLQQPADRAKDTFHTHKEQLEDNDESIKQQLLEPLNETNIEQNDYGSSDETTWPKPFNDESAIQQNRAPKELPPTYTEIRKQVHQTKNLVIRTITWNQEAPKELPSVKDLVTHLIQRRMYHVIVVGTQECENDFCRSILNPSKVKWETKLADTIGTDYEMVRCHALQASHIAICIHKAILHLVSNIQSHAVPTGVYDTLGNKGGIGVSLKIGSSSFCFVTAHLAAHQNQIDRRTHEFRKISHDIAETIGYGSSSGGGDYSSTLSLSPNVDDNGEGDTNDITPSSSKKRIEEYDDNDDDDDDGDSDTEYKMSDEFLSREESDEESLCKQCCYRCGPSSNSSSTSRPQCSSSISSCRKRQQTTKSSSSSSSKQNPLTTAFDFVFWAGDMNFRINGTRPIIDNLLHHDRYNVLMNNEQLSMLMQFDPLFAGLMEGPITFRPTYKFDRGTDNYDTSPKQRIPSWTDRILYKKNNGKVDIISYSSAKELRTSDHRPVYSTFVTQIDLGDDEEEEEWIDHGNTNNDAGAAPLWNCETKSEVCVIS